MFHLSSFYCIHVYAKHVPIRCQTKWQTTTTKTIKIRLFYVFGTYRVQTAVFFCSNLPSHVPNTCANKRMFIDQKNREITGNLIEKSRIFANSEDIYMQNFRFSDGNSYQRESISKVMNYRNSWIHKYLLQCWEKMPFLKVHSFKANWQTSNLKNCASYSALWRDLLTT